MDREVLEIEIGVQVVAAAAVPVDQRGRDRLEAKWMMRYRPQQARRG